MKYYRTILCALMVVVAASSALAGGYIDGVEQTDFTESVAADITQGDINNWDNVTNLIAGANVTLLQTNGDWYIIAAGSAVATDTVARAATVINSNRIEDVAASADSVSNTVDGIVTDTVGISNRTLHTSTPEIVADWETLSLFETDGDIRANWDNGELYNDGTVTIDWAAKTLANQAGQTVVEWEDDYLKDDSAVTSVDWDSRNLHDSGESNSVDWANRTLQIVDERTILNWGSGLLVNPNYGTWLRWYGSTNIDVYTNMDFYGNSLYNVGTNSIIFEDGGRISTSPDSIEYTSGIGTQPVYQLVGPSLSQYHDTESDVSDLSQDNIDNQARLDFTERNTSLNAFRIQINGSLSGTPMADGYSDEFEDQTGVDLGDGSNYTYNADDDAYAWTASGFDLSDDMILNYESEDNAADTVVVNSNGPTANAVLNSGTTAAASTGGIVGNALDLTNNYWVTPVNSITNSQYNQAVSFWFKSVKGDTLFLGGMTDTFPLSAASQLEWKVSVQAYLGYQFATEVGHGVSSIDLDNFGPTGLNDGNWHHAAVNFSQNSVQVWVDGTDYGSAVLGGTRRLKSAVRLVMGVRPFGTLSANATIDQVRFWDRHITSDEYDWLWNGGSGRFEMVEPGGNMELVATNYYMTAIDPEEAKIVCLMQETTTTLVENVDFKAWVSDDGTNWYQSILTDYGQVETNMTLFDGTVTNTTGAGYTNLRWRITTHNDTAGRVHGVAIQARE